MAQQGQWQVAGSAPEVYERELVPAVFGAWAPILTDLAQPKLGERVVDIACGTGIIARIAAAKIGRTGVVAGIDLNPGMLTVARSLKTTNDAASVQGTKPVRTGCRCRTACSTLPIASSASNSSPIGWLPCAKCAESCLRRVGSLSWYGAAYMKVRGLIHLPKYLSGTSVQRRSPFALSDADELSRLVADADFQDIRVQRRAGTVEFPSVERFVLSYVAGSPLAGHVSQASDMARERLMIDAKSALEKYVDSRGLSFPIAAHLLAASV